MSIGVGGMIPLMWGMDSFPHLVDDTTHFSLTSQSPLRGKGWVSTSLLQRSRLTYSVTNGKFRASHV